jgi:Asp-tRNA(Asn)/Glu-tRNA(Gln) amidotransferase A subunit family amidase
MTKPCDLTATEARRLIGERKLSPVELLESLLATFTETRRPVPDLAALAKAPALAQAMAPESSERRSHAHHSPDGH